MKVEATITKIRDDIPDAQSSLDHAQTAWKEIEAADTFVKKTIGEINAAERWITIGKRLHDLHATLDRISRHDKKAPGWNKAFADGRFNGMSAKTASRVAIIGDKFTGSESEPVKALPGSWYTLYLLAQGFQSVEALQPHIANGTVTPVMTETQAIALVAAHGKPPEGPFECK
jgi:hypothetical protein